MLLAQIECRALRQLKSFSISARWFSPLFSVCSGKIFTRGYFRKRQRPRSVSALRSWQHYCSDDSHHGTWAASFTVISIFRVHNASQHPCCLASHWSIASVSCVSSDVANEAAAAGAASKWRLRTRQRVTCYFPCCGESRWLEHTPDAITEGAGRWGCRGRHRTL